jgi:hypothetical protein
MISVVTHTLYKYLPFAGGVLSFIDNFGGRSPFPVLMPMSRSLFKASNSLKKTKCENEKKK